MFEPIAYDIPTVIEMTGIGRTTIFGEIRDGKLVARKIGRRTVLMATDVRKWLEATPTVRNANPKAAS